jgi:hypothetical protein
MSADGSAPWIAAWQRAQRDFEDLAAAWSQTPAGLPAFEAFQVPLAEQYRRLFAPPGIPSAIANAGAAGAATLRLQKAAERYGQLLSVIASDAGRRLAAQLAATGPDAPPITTVRELHALWIECGEAAWTEAAHEEAFATAQAELLGALVELRAQGAGP